MKSLGQVLVEKYGLAQESLEEALSVQKEKGGRIGELLVQQKKISSSDLLKARSEQCGLTLLKEVPDNLDSFFTSRVPIQFLKKFKMIPVATPEESYIAIADPFYFQQVDDLQRVLNWEGIKPLMAPQEEIFKAINASYDKTSQDHADQVMQDMDVDDPEAIISEILDERYTA